MTQPPPPPPPPSTPPPGVPGGYGEPESLTADEKTWAMLANIGGIVIGFLAGLIVMLTKGKESDFVRDQAVEALNFQITVAIAYFVSFILIFVLIGLLLIVVVGIGSLVLMIMAGIAANNGQRYRYPINIRLVK
ncbi:MAG: DUF4870 domain-containing protein [Acidimicrobiia bacterium]